MAFFFALVTFPNSCHSKSCIFPFSFAPSISFEEFKKRSTVNNMFSMLYQGPYISA